MNDITNSIMDYFKKESVDYAIMIDGDWGSGKTFFWNKILRPRIEGIKIKVNDNEGKEKEEFLKVIYISLYGITNLDDINKSIFIETSMKGMAKGKVPEIAKMLLNGASLMGVSLGTNNIDLSKFYSLKNKVLCFDDLERAKIDVAIILGYINNLVEHDNVKTIIISNEKEIMNKFYDANMELKTLSVIQLLRQTNTGKGRENHEITKQLIDQKITELYEDKSEYCKIKEKLIGKTFKYCPNFPLAIKEIISNYKDDNLNNFLLNSFETIIKTFCNSQTSNLRLLKHALDDFQKIYSMVTENHNDIKETIQDSLLIFTLAITFEIKSGKIKKEQFEKLISISDIQSQILTSELLKHKKSYFKEFSKRYYSFFSKEIYFYKFVEVYVNTGIFDEKVFNDNIASIRNSLKPEKRKSYYIFNEYWKLSNEEFSSAIKETLDDIKYGRIHFTQYLRAFMIYSMFSKQGLIEEDLPALKSICLIGIDMASIKTDYYENISSIYIGLNLDGQTDLNEIKEYIVNRNSTLLFQRRSRDANTLIRLLQENIEELYSKLDREFSGVPMFKFLNPSSLYQSVRVLSNPEIVYFRNIVADRLNNTNYSEELPVFIQLAKSLESDIRNEPLSLRTVLLKELSTTLKNGKC